MVESRYSKTAAIAFTVGVIWMSIPHQILPYWMYGLVALAAFTVLVASTTCHVVVIITTATRNKYAKKLKHIYFSLMHELRRQTVTIKAVNDISLLGLTCPKRNRELTSGMFSWKFVSQVQGSNVKTVIKCNQGTFTISFLDNGEPLVSFDDSEGKVTGYNIYNGPYLKQAIMEMGVQDSLHYHKLCPDDSAGTTEPY